MTESMGRALDPVPVPVADVKVEVIEGELLLYHPGQTRAVYLNPPAALIWSLCDGQRQVHEIIRLIGESYPDLKANLAEEVLETLRRLYEDGVLTTR
jgi:hypothetical protein